MLIYCPVYVKLGYVHLYYVECKVKNGSEKYFSLDTFDYNLWKTAYDNSPKNSRSAS